MCDNRDELQFGASVERCVACGGCRVSYWGTKSRVLSDRQACRFSIFKCADCGTGFLNPPPSIACLERIYRCSGHGLTGPAHVADVLESERRFPNSSVDAHRMVSMACSMNKSQSWRSLDVGAGYGFVTREMLRQGLSVTSINPGEYENVVFEAMNGFRPQVTLFEKYSPDGQFGIVVLSQVLEHMLEPAMQIRRIHDMLAPGGALVIAVPNFNSAAVKILGTRDNGCLWVPEHVNYFTDKGLRMLLRRLDFEVVHTHQVTRVRPDVISRRLPLRGGARIMETVTRYAQVPVCLAASAIGRGLYINAYARRRRSGARNG